LDHLKLTAAIDSKNVTFTDVEADGGSKVPASVLFPNDPKRRLEVWWSDPDASSDIHLIVIGGQSTWTAPGGVQLGQTLEQVEKLLRPSLCGDAFAFTHVSLRNDRNAA
jgi:hypothetical protein